jgi:transcriptional repressor NrdR
MICPKCDNESSKVLDSRSQGSSIRRRRECLICEERFTTYERIEVRYPLVIKSDGSREIFSREKIRVGLTLACRKRKISAADLDKSVRKIEKSLLELSVDEISSNEIGMLVLETLQGLDMVAYLRFASVYLEVTTPKDFLALLQPWVPELSGLLREDNE